MSVSLSLLALLSSPLQAAPSPASLQAGPPARPFCGCTHHGGYGSGSQMRSTSQPASDCEYLSNVAGAEYDPAFVMRIPVVWHIVQRADGTGDLSDQTIIEQMAKLNDDFRPAPGAPGTDSLIEFVFATTDPAGAPTNGIERVVNDVWFEDRGPYASQLAWDPRAYLNVYTMNTLEIGYVPDLPQGGLVGQPRDGIRLLYSEVNTVQWDYALTHEVGHYLGLYHTFGAGLDCTNTDCQTQGDLICDTNPHRGPTFSCTGNPANCGGQPVPRDNFMNYQLGTCVFEFTPGQIQRMRCTLEHWRPVVWETPSLGTAYCAAAANSTGGPGQIAATGSEFAGVNSVSLAASALPSGSFGFFLVSQTQGFVQGAGGSAGNLCLGGSIGRYVGPGQIQQADAQGEFTLDLDLAQTPTPLGPVAIQAGETWSFQAWFRDSAMGQPTSNFTGGLGIAFR